MRSWVSEPPSAERLQCSSTANVNMRNLVSEAKRSVLPSLRPFVVTACPPTWFTYRPSVWYLNSMRTVSPELRTLSERTAIHGPSSCISSSRKRGMRPVLPKSLAFRSRRQTPA